MNIIFLLSVSLLKLKFLGSNATQATWYVTHMWDFSHQTGLLEEIDSNFPLDGITVT